MLPPENQKATKDREIIWNSKNWAYGCDFYASNFASTGGLRVRDCEKLCRKTEACTHYSLTPDGDGSGRTGNCGLKSGEVTKEDAFVVDNTKVICGVLGKPFPEWHIIIGGRNVYDLTSVEAYNWETGEQCNLNDLPVGLSLHSATSFDGVPMICGGHSMEIPQVSCYKYLDLADAWSPSSNLLAGAAAGSANVLVPGRGWFLFGSEGNSITRSQVLANPTGRWQLGPSFYQTRYVNGECLVQLNDTHTVFLGGLNDPHGIVLFNWTTETYTKLRERLAGKHWKSACALLKTGDGDPLVAVAGGVHREGKGMELWDPKESKVKRVSKNLPTEKDQGIGLSHAQLVPINDGSQALLYGGFQGDYRSDIWKYTVDNSSWEKQGQLLEAREELTVLPVLSVNCLK